MGSDQNLIHPTAIISKRVVLGKNVSIGAYSTVWPDVHIGDDTVVGAYCELGHPGSLSIADRTLKIGANSTIRSHSILYEGSTFGDNLNTGNRVTVRENTQAGNNLQIGTLSDIQGNCTIGNFVRLHSNVHIGQKTTIEDYVWIYPYVVITNDPHPPSNVLMGVTIKSFAVVATMSVILPGVTIEGDSLVAAHSMVNKDVKSGTVVGGSPAKVLCNTDKIALKDAPYGQAYPWRRHFHRGYAEEDVLKWIEEFK